jgi:hypothetical protein
MELWLNLTLALELSPSQSVFFWGITNLVTHWWYIVASWYEATYFSLEVRWTLSRVVNVCVRVCWGSYLGAG